MAEVKVDFSEYDAMRTRIKELEETCKEQKETIKSLKDGSRVIIRREQVIEFEQSSMYDEMLSRSQACYNSDRKQRQTIETSEQYVNFEDVRLKVEKEFKDQIERSIKQRDEAYDHYNSLSAELKEDYEKKELSLKEDYEKKEASLNKEFSDKETELNQKIETKQAELKKKFDDMVSAYHKEQKALSEQHHFRLLQYCEMFSYFNEMKPDLEKAVKLYNSKRFFKPKGIDTILVRVISDCDKIIQKNKGH